jgi:translocation and assembly module TamA
VLLPTRGRVWNGQVGFGQARSDPGRAGAFVRLYGRLHLFHPFADRWYASGRIELGQVFARSGVLVPEALRFRAGGDESVRGYEYRSLAPVVDGVQTSGKVLFTASAEVARPILERLPQLWGAAFIDVGRAADRWGDLNPAVGVGVGVRYRSPVGPAKLDLAWGQEVRRLRLHLSVGVTF